jgi:hypothetical protein
MIPSKTKIPAAIGSIMSEIELPGDQTLNWPVTAAEGDRRASLNLRTFTRGNGRGPLGRNVDQEGFGHRQAKVAREARTDDLTRQIDVALVAAARKLGDHLHAGAVGGFTGDEKRPRFGRASLDGHIGLVRHVSARLVPIPLAPTACDFDRQCPATCQALILNERITRFGRV